MTITMRVQPNVPWGPWLDAVRQVLLDTDAALVGIRFRYVDERTPADIVFTLVPSLVEPKTLRPLWGRSLPWRRGEARRIVLGDNTPPRARRDTIAHELGHGLHLRHAAEHLRDTVMRPCILEADDPPLGGFGPRDIVNLRRRHAR